MVGLLLLKQLENLSYEVVFKRWIQNPYYQYFCGTREFKWDLPCNPSDLVYFRNRIGEEGVHLIFAITTNLHRNPIEKEIEILVDTTAQEKNITLPTATKLYSRIIGRCWRMTGKYGIKLRRRYRKELRQCLLSQRWRSHPEKGKLTRRAQKCIKTIAGILLRELKRKLPEQILKAHLEDFKLYLRVLNQKKNDKNKVYSLHEPQTYCIPKGKENKKYEYGSKASLAVTADTGSIGIS
jgi:transposase, IS5 family